MRTTRRPPRPLSPAQKLRVAFELADAAVEMMKARIRREHPVLSSWERAALLVRWVQTRPGAEWGDGEGRPVPWHGAR
ncbi:MAG: hypothetical protein HY904_18105 [Deltaproteobacteria bacterium]|nr:hypothetical protein [Deltaproteobacteria bacterium]